jgi:hypothetical protein
MSRISSTILRGFKQLGSKFQEGPYATLDYTDTRIKTPYNISAYLANPTFWLRKHPVLHTEYWKNRTAFHEKYKHYKCVPTATGFFDVNCRKVYPTLEQWAQAAAAEFGIELTAPIEEEILWGRTQLYLTLGQLLTKINERLPPPTLEKSPLSIDVILEKIKKNLSAYEAPNKWYITDKNHIPSNFLYINGEDISTVFISNIGKKKYTPSNPDTLYQYQCGYHNKYSPILTETPSELGRYHVRIHSRHGNKWVKITELLS